jgi:hypothetical protein
MDRYLYVRSGRFLHPRSRKHDGPFSEVSIARCFGRPSGDILIADMKQNEPVWVGLVETLAFSE